MKRLPNIFFIDLMALIVIILLLFLSSCTTGRKAVKWFDSHPKEAAQYALQRFPTDTVTKLIPGEKIVVSDTVTKDVKIPCYPSADTTYITIPKTRTITKTITVTDTLVRTIDRPEKDVIIQSQKEEIAVMAENLKNAKRKAEKRNIKFFGLLGLVGIGIFLKIKKII